MSNQVETATIERLELKVGQEFEVALEDGNGRVLRCDVLEVVKTPGPHDPPNAYCLKRKEGEALEGEVEAEAPVAGAAAEADGSSPFDVLKFAWQIVKDGKPTNHTKGASSFVLYKGTDPMDYGHSKEGRSSQYSLIVRDKTFRDVVLVEAKFSLEGAYGATPNPAKKEIPHGQYLPSIYFGIPTCHVNVPFIDFEGEATMGPPYNVGSHDNVQPRVKVYAKFTVTVLWSSHSWSWGFEADGKDGFKGTGPV